MERLVVSSFCPCRPRKKLTYISPPENRSAAAQPMRAIWSSEALLNNSMGRLAEKCRVVCRVALLKGRSRTSQKEWVSDSNGSGFGQIARPTPMKPDRSSAQVHSAPVWSLGAGPEVSGRLCRECRFRRDLVAVNGGIRWLYLKRQQQVTRCGQSLFRQLEPPTRLDPAAAFSLMSAPAWRSDFYRWRVSADRPSGAASSGCRSPLSSFSLK
jgi:hypothetical protein